MNDIREDLEKRLTVASRHPRARAVAPELTFARTALSRRDPLDDVALALDTAELILGIRREEVA